MENQIPEQKAEETTHKSSAQFENIDLNSWASIKGFLIELIDIRSDTDRDATIDAVKKDIPFKGHTAWILVFSIFIASIGLNVSSTAVVIGAMLISPLMGPIVGVGLSVAINDVDTLKRSLVNLGVMVGISVLTAFVYFKLSPLTEETPELLARTYPTILDVFVAIFGGLALIVAKTKNGTIASVIFGVAIATALMPPLCTVGYGLAISNWHYAGGALYLFSINAVFIALSTFIVSKILRFPLVRYANSKRRKRIAQIASLIAIIVIVPSVILFLNLLKQQVFIKRSKNFVRTEIKYDGAEVVKSTQDYETKHIDVYLIGQPVPEEKIEEWKLTLKEFEDLQEAELYVFQGADQSNALAERLSGEVKSGILEDLYLKNDRLLKDKDAKIEFLENEIKRMRFEEVPFKDLSQEAKINYSGLTTFSFSRRIRNTFSTIDTIPVYTVSWENTISRKVKKENMDKLKSWLIYKTKDENLILNEVN